MYSENSKTNIQIFAKVSIIRFIIFTTNISSTNIYVNKKSQIKIEKDAVHFVCI